MHAWARASDESGDSPAKLAFSANLVHIIDRQHRNSHFARVLATVCGETVFLDRGQLLVAVRSGTLERVKGIEPSSSDWKSEVLAVELHPQAGKE